MADHAILDLGEDDLQFTTNDYKVSSIKIATQHLFHCLLFEFKIYN